MRLDECYRLLDLEPGASQEEVRRAHRDLTKVWHPDRFGHDAALRRKAEEKLKAINQAYEAIQAGRPGRDDDHRQPASNAREREREVRHRMLAITCGLVAAFVLLRRPSVAGLAIALVLFAAAFFFARIRRSGGG